MGDRAMLNLKSCHISNWLICVEEVRSPTIRYRYRKIREDLDGRAWAIPVLKKIVELAHEDARRYLRKCIESNLDPLQDTPSASIVDAYPHHLHLNVKKAYF